MAGVVAGEELLDIKGDGAVGIEFLDLDASTVVLAFLLVVPLLTDPFVSLTVDFLMDGVSTRVSFFDVGEGEAATSVSDSSDSSCFSDNAELLAAPDFFFCFFFFYQHPFFLGCRNICYVFSTMFLTLKFRLS